MWGMALKKHASCKHFRSLDHLCTQIEAAVNYLACVSGYIVDFFSGLIS